jgi:hypothetical protein
MCYAKRTTQLKGDVKMRKNYTNVLPEDALPRRFTHGQDDNFEGVMMNVIESIIATPSLLPNDVTLQRIIVEGNRETYFIHRDNWTKHLVVEYLPNGSVRHVLDYSTNDYRELMEIHDEAFADTEMLQDG